MTIPVASNAEKMARIKINGVIFFFPVDKDNFTDEEIDTMRMLARKFKK